MTEAELPLARRTLRPVRAMLSVAAGAAGLLALEAVATGAVPDKEVGRHATPTRVAAPPKTASPKTASPPTTTAPPAVGALTIRSMPEGAELALTLSRPSPAAAFQYGGHLWIVIATAETVTRTPAGSPGVPVVAGLEIVRLKRAVALRLPRRRGHRLTARRRQATWSFVYAKADRDGRASAKADRDGRASAARLKPTMIAATLDTTVVSIADSHLTTVHRLVDPVVGATLIVATSTEPGIAVRAAYRTAAFRLLPTRLGLAVEIRADGVDIERQETGVRVVYRRSTAVPARP